MTSLYGNHFRDPAPAYFRYARYPRDQVSKNGWQAFFIRMVPGGSSPMIFSDSEHDLAVRGKKLGDPLPPQFQKKSQRFPYTQDLPYMIIMPH
jgi:hypothetical protein